MEVLKKGRAIEVWIDTDPPAEEGRLSVNIPFMATATSPCGEVERRLRLVAPSEVVFQLSDASRCDGCVGRLTAREPGEGVDVQFEMQRVTYRGACPYIGTSRLRI